MVLRISKTGIALSVALGLAVGTGSAGAKSVDELHENLRRAVCLNDWTGAIALINPLIAYPDLSATYRQTMVDLRDQLAEWDQAAIVIPEINQCEAILRRYVPASEIPAPSPPSPPAITVLLNRQGPPPARTQAVSQQEAFVIADLDKFELEDLPALSPALMMNLESGSGVAAGLVGTNEQIHSFFGGFGDRVTLDVDVTRVLPGIFEESDDTQLFLFDASGRLIAENDNDDEGLQSKLENLLLPRTGRYYVAVTTGGNAPILDEADRIVDWSLSGGNTVEYTLTIRGVTPTETLILTNYGPE